jgi:hypothetical protein
MTRLRKYLRARADFRQLGLWSPSLRRRVWDWSR